MAKLLVVKLFLIDPARIDPVFFTVITSFIALRLNGNDSIVQDRDEAKNLIFMEMFPFFKSVAVPLKRISHPRNRW